MSKRGSSFKNPLNGKEVNKKRNVCGACSKSFGRRCELNRHMKTCGKPAALRCDECGRYFSRRDLLKRHIDTIHRPVKRHRCPFCDTTFKRLHDQKRHIARGKCRTSGNLPLPLCEVSYKLDLDEEPGLPQPEHDPFVHTGQDEPEVVYKLDLDEEPGLSQPEHDPFVHTGQDENADEPEPEEPAQVSETHQTTLTSSPTNTTPESIKDECPGFKRQQSQTTDNNQTILKEALNLERRKVELLESRFAAPQPRDLAEEDDDFSFFKSLIPSLKELPLLRRMILRSKIMNCVIAELQPGQPSNRPWPCPPIVSNEPPRHYTTYHLNLQYVSNSSETCSDPPHPYTSPNHKIPI